MMMRPPGAVSLQQLEIEEDNEAMEMTTGKKGGQEQVNLQDQQDEEGLDPLNTSPDFVNNPYVNAGH